jgi:hypothetical protein
MTSSLFLMKRQSSLRFIALEDGHKYFLQSLGSVRFWDGLEWNGTVSFLKPILAFGWSEERN